MEENVLSHISLVMLVSSNVEIEHDAGTHFFFAYEGDAVGEKPLQKYNTFRLRT